MTRPEYEVIENGKRKASCHVVSLDPYWVVNPDQASVKLGSHHALVCVKKVFKGAHKQFKVNKEYVISRSWLSPTLGGWESTRASCLLPDEISLLGTEDDEVHEWSLYVSERPGKHSDLDFWSIEEPGHSQHLGILIQLKEVASMINMSPMLEIWLERPLMETFTKVIVQAKGFRWDISSFSQPEEMENVHAAVYDAIVEEATNLLTKSTQSLWGVAQKGKRLQFSDAAAAEPSAPPASSSGKRKGAPAVESAPPPKKQKTTAAQAAPSAAKKSSSASTSRPRQSTSAPKKPSMPKNPPASSSTPKKSPASTSTPKKPTSSTTPKKPTSTLKKSKVGDKQQLLYTDDIKFKVEVDRCVINPEYNHRRLNMERVHELGKDMLEKWWDSDIAYLLPYVGEEETKRFLQWPELPVDKQGCEIITESSFNDKNIFFFVVSGQHSISAQQQLKGSRSLPIAIREKVKSREARLVRGTAPVGDILQLSKSNNDKDKSVFFSPLYDQYVHLRRRWISMGMPQPPDKRGKKGSDSYQEFHQIARVICSKDDVYFITKFVSFPEDAFDAWISVFEKNYKAQRLRQNFPKTGKSNKSKKVVEDTVQTNKDPLTHNILRNIILLHRDDLLKCAAKVINGEISLKNTKDGKSLQAEATRLRHLRIFKEFLPEFVMTEFPVKFPRRPKYEKLKRMFDINKELEKEWIALLDDVLTIRGSPKASDEEKENPKLPPAFVTAARRRYREKVGDDDLRDMHVDRRRFRAYGTLNVFQQDWEDILTENKEPFDFMVYDARPLAVLDDADGGMDSHGDAAATGSKGGKSKSGKGAATAKGSKRGKGGNKQLVAMSEMVAKLQRVTSAAEYSVLYILKQEQVGVLQELLKETGVNLGRSCKLGFCEEDTGVFMLYVVCYGRDPRIALYLSLTYGEAHEFSEEILHEHGGLLGGGTLFPRHAGAILDEARPRKILDVGTNGCFLAEAIGQGIAAVGIVEDDEKAEEWYQMAGIADDLENEEANTGAGDGRDAREEHPRSCGSDGEKSGDEEKDLLEQEGEDGEEYEEEEDEEEDEVDDDESGEDDKAKGKAGNNCNTSSSDEEDEEDDVDGVDDLVRGRASKKQIARSDDEHEEDDQTPVGSENTINEHQRNCDSSDINHEEDVDPQEDTDDAEEQDVLHNSEMQPVINLGSESVTDWVAEARDGDETPSEEDATIHPKRRRQGIWKVGNKKNKARLRVVKGDDVLTQKPRGPPVPKKRRAKSQCPPAAPQGLPVVNEGAVDVYTEESSEKDKFGEGMDIQKEVLPEDLHGVHASDMHSMAKQDEPVVIKCNTPAAGVLDRSGVHAVGMHSMAKEDEPKSDPYAANVLDGVHATGMHSNTAVIAETLDGNKLEAPVVVPSEDIEGGDPKADAPKMTDEIPETLDPSDVNVQLGGDPKAGAPKMTDEIPETLDPSDDNVQLGGDPKAGAPKMTDEIPETLDPSDDNVQLGGDPKAGAPKMTDEIPETLDPSDDNVQLGGDPKAGAPKMTDEIPETLDPSDDNVQLGGDPKAGAPKMTDEIPETLDSSDDNVRGDPKAGAPKITDKIPETLDRSEDNVQLEGGDPKADVHVVFDTLNVCGEHGPYMQPTEDDVSTAIQHSKGLKAPINSIISENDEVEGVRKLDSEAIVPNDAVHAPHMHSGDEMHDSGVGEETKTCSARASEKDGKRAGKKQKPGNRTPSRRGKQKKVSKTLPSNTFSDPLMHLDTQELFDLIDKQTKQPAKDSQPEDSEDSDETHIPGTPGADAMGKNSRVMCVLFELEGVFLHYDASHSSGTLRDTNSAVRVRTSQKRSIYVRKELDQFFKRLQDQLIIIGTWTSARESKARDFLSVLEQLSSSFRAHSHVCGNILLHEDCCTKISQTGATVKSYNKLQRHRLWGDGGLCGMDIVLVDADPVANSLNHQVAGVHPRTFDPFNHSNVFNSMVLEKLANYLINMGNSRLNPRAYIAQNIEDNVFRPQLRYKNQRELAASLTLP